MSVLLLLLVLLPAMAPASPSPSPNPRQQSGPALGLLRAQPAAHYKDSINYKYQYAVDDPYSGVVNDRWEQRSGDFVKGQYSLLDPDGKVRTVDYEVDGERGFHAVIRTQFPAHSLLSIQSDNEVRDTFRDPEVNVLAKAGVGVPEFALRNPRFSVRDNLPFNYHALDASKLGIHTEEEGLDSEHLQHLGRDEALGLAPALTPREVHRRKYHRDNHLLPHEREQREQREQRQRERLALLDPLDPLLFHDQLDLGRQLDVDHQVQDSQHDQQFAKLSAVSSSRNSVSGDVISPSSVYNPRAEYINLHPYPRPLAPLPPPNPAVASTAPPPPTTFNLLQATRRAPPSPASISVPLPPEFAYFRPTPEQQQQQLLRQRAPTQLHTLAILSPAPVSSRVSASNPTPSRRAAAAGPSRIRVVQHHTETSPGLSSSRSYYL